MLFFSRSGRILEFTSQFTIHIRRNVNLGGIHALPYKNVNPVVRFTFFLWIHGFLASSMGWPLASWFKHLGCRDSREGWRNILSRRRSCGSRLGSSYLPLPFNGFELWQILMSPPPQQHRINTHNNQWLPRRWQPTFLQPTRTFESGS